MEKCKERKIGQQIMAVRMIKCENTNVLKGGMSFLKIETLANGMDVSKDEINNLVILCKRLDFDDIRFRVTSALYNSVAGASAETKFSYIYDALYWFGDEYIKALISDDTINFDFHKRENIFAQKIFRNGELLNNSNREGFKQIFEKSLKLYAKTYVEEILGAYEDGVDCDVIAAIVKPEIFGEEVTEELLRRLKDVVLD